MKKNPNRHALFKSACTLIAALSLGTGANAQITWDFNDGTMQGWENVLGHDHGVRNGNGNLFPFMHNGDRDRHSDGSWDLGHWTQVTYSPKFQFTDLAVDLTWVDPGGNNNRVNHEDTPVELLNIKNFLTHPVLDDREHAFYGIALQNCTTGDFVWSQWANRRVMTSADLTANANLTDNFRLAYIDMYAGSWGWGRLDQVNIPGAVLSTDIVLSKHRDWDIEVGAKENVAVSETVSLNAPPVAAPIVTGLPASGNVIATVAAANADIVLSGTPLAADVGEHTVSVDADGAVSTFTLRITDAALSQYPLTVGAGQALKIDTRFGIVTVDGVPVTPLSASVASDKELDAFHPSPDANIVRDWVFSTCTLWFDSINIDATATVELLGDIGLQLCASGDITIGANLVANGSPNESAPISGVLGTALWNNDRTGGHSNLGPWGSGDRNRDEGRGPGGGKEHDHTPTNGGGGAGYGGNGGDNQANTYGDKAITRLLPGSGGGSGSTRSGGAGGGAIGIKAEGNLVVSGLISVNGGDGRTNHDNNALNNGGGGSGGAIRLSGATVDISGADLQAIGGSSTEFGGGGGRICVNSPGTVTTTGSSISVDGGAGASGPGFAGSLKLPGLTTIVLAGDNPQIQERATPWVDPGVADVLDDLDVTLGAAAIDSVTVDSSAIDVNVSGAYPVVYSYVATPPLQDSSVTRTVTVVDTIPGIVTLIDDTPAANEILAGTGPWTDPGANSTDVNGGEVLNVFSSGARPLASEALGKWTFDDDTADDSSNNANHGRLLANTSFSDDTPYGTGRSISFGGGNSGVEVSDGTPEQGTFDVKPYFQPLPPGQLEIVGPWDVEATTGIAYTVVHGTPFTADNDMIDAAVLADPGLATSQADAINFGNGNQGRLPGDTPGPLSGLDNVAFRATGTLRVLVEDDYLIGSQNDDGFSLLIETGGAQFESALVENATGNGRVIKDYLAPPTFVNSGSLGAAADMGSGPLGDPFLTGGAHIPLLEQPGVLVDPAVPSLVSNNSMGFPGNQFLGVDNNPALNVEDPDVGAIYPGALAELSVEFWAKADGNGNLLSPLSNIVFDGPNRRGWLFYQRPDDSWEWRVGGAAGYIAPLAGAPGEIVYGQWTHVVGVLQLDKTDPADPFYTVELYVDGVLANSAFLPAVDPLDPAGAIPLINPTGQVRIGSTTQNTAGVAGRFFNGCLDEVAIYDTALDAATVAAHYANGINTPARTQTYPDLIAASNPLAYWRGEEAAPGVNTDVTGLFDPSATGNSSTVGRIHLTPGDYPISFIMREGGGGEYAELFARRDVAGETGWSALTNGGSPGIPKGGLMYTSFFAKRDGWSGADGWAAFVSKAGDGGVGWQIRRRGGENSITYTRRGAGNDDPTGASQAIANGDWHHVMTCLDGDNVRVWIDGQIDASFANSGTVNPAVGYSLAFGVRDAQAGPTGPTNNKFRGQMDDICIYNTPLTDEQLFAHVSGGDAVNTNVPGDYNVRYIAFDAEGNGGVATRVVTVLPNPALPVIVLTGGDETIEATLDPYVDPGALAETGPGAPSPGDPLGAATASGSVDLTTPGIYILSYDYSDVPNGTALTVQRFVTVVDTTGPDIALIGPNPIMINEGDELLDPGANATDLVSGPVGVLLDEYPGQCLLGRWSFDDPANPGKDDSGMGRHVTLLGGALTDDFEAPLAGRFLDCSGGNRGAIVAGGPAANDLFEAGGQSFSVGSWVRGWPNGNWEPWIAKRGESQGWQLRRRGGETNACFTTRGSGQDDNQATPVPQDGLWHHVMAVYDRTTNIKTIYVDGVAGPPSGATNGNNLNNATNHALTFCGRDNGGGNVGNWSGQAVDDVQIYRKALTPEQIADLADPLTGVDYVPNTPGEGTFDLTYRATDAAGNTSILTRTVIVGPPVPDADPVLVDVELNAAQDTGTLHYTGLVVGTTYHIVVSLDGDNFGPVAGSEFTPTAADDSLDVPVDIVANPLVIVKLEEGPIVP